MVGTLEEKEIYIPDEHLKNIFGEFDKNLSILEKKLSVYTKFSIDNSLF